MTVRFPTVGRCRGSAAWWLRQRLEPDLQEPRPDPVCENRTPHVSAAGRLTSSRSGSPTRASHRHSRTAPWSSVRTRTGPRIGPGADASSTASFV